MIFPASTPPFGRRGTSNLSLTGNGTDQTIVASGANVNGLLVRSVFMIAGINNQAWFRIGGVNVLGANNLGQFNFFLPAIYVPPGVAISFFNSAVGGEIAITWDFL